VCVCEGERVCVFEGECVCVCVGVFVCVCVCVCLCVCGRERDCALQWYKRPPRHACHPRVYV